MFAHETARETVVFTPYIQYIHMSVQVHYTI